MKITEDGFYDLPEADYHADPCASPSLSSSLVSAIVGGTMAEARWKHPRLNPLLEQDDSTKFDLGNVAHAILLGKGRDIEAIDASDWRTKAAQQSRADALEAGRMPVLLSVLEQAEAMAEAARDQLADNADSAQAFVQGMGIAEQTAIATLATAHGDVTCRALLDWRDLASSKAGRPIIFDYKTKRDSADPSDFARYIFGEDRDVQDPFYSLVIAKLLAVDPREVEFRFVVQSAKPPYPLAVVQMDDQAREFAFERVSYAMNKWAAARATNQWPGFLPRTHFIAPPSFAMHRWGEKVMAEQFASQLDARAEAQAVETEGN